MVNPVPRANGGLPIGLNNPTIMAASNSPFPSTIKPPDWFTVPSYNSAIMNPDTNTLGIPWYNFLTFISARAAALGGVSDQVTTLQGQVAVLQGQVSVLQGQVATINAEIATIQGQITTLQSQVGTNTNDIITLQGQVSTLQGQVTTIQSQITALQATDANLQNQINVIDAIFAVSTVASLPAPAGNQGRRTNVSDATTVVFGTVVVGSGTSFAPVYCDGTNWLIG